MNAMRCQCCGQPLPGDRAAMFGIGGESSLAILQRLIEKPEGQTTAQLVHWLYHLDPNGGPSDADGTVKTLICKLRQKLRARGVFDIVGIGWGPRVYRLVRIEREAA